MTNIPDETLEKLLDLCSETTPGPWKKDVNWHISGPEHGTHRPALSFTKSDGVTTRPAITVSQYVCQVSGPPGYSKSDKDQDFIIAAKEYFEPLLIELLELRRQKPITEQDLLDVAQRAGSRFAWSPEDRSELAHQAVDEQLRKTLHRSTK